MTNHATPIEALFEKAEDYSKTTLELIKLNVIDKSADLGSHLAVQLVTFIIAIFSALFLNIGIALWIGELLGKIYYGFFVVTGFYVLGGVLLYSFRHQWIKIPVSNSIIIQLLKKR